MTNLIHQPLFRTPTARKGAARAVSLFGKLDQYVSMPTAKDADARALASDWKAVGFDIHKAITQYGKAKTK